MTIVQHILRNPATLEVLAKQLVTVRLRDMGFVDGGHSQIVGESTALTDVTGLYQVDLTPQSQIDPWDPNTGIGTYYEVTHPFGEVLQFVVTDAAGPLWLRPLIRSTVDPAGNVVAGDPFGSAAAAQVAAIASAATLSRTLTDLDLWDRFADHPDGAIAAANTGQAYVPLGYTTGVDPTAKPVIVAGKLSTTYFGATASAGYVQSNLTRNLKRIGARWSFHAGPGGDTTHATAGLIAWAADYTPNAGVAIPDSICHLAISATGWTYSVVTAGSGVLTAVPGGSGTFVTPLAIDGVTVHACDVVIDRANATAYVHLPDGSVATVTHAAIKTVASSWAVWENFRSASTFGYPEFTEVWADTRRDEPIVQAKVLAQQYGAWNTLTPNGAWVQYVATGAYPLLPQWRREGNYVRVRFALKGGSLTVGSPLITLPIPPLYGMIVNTACSTGVGQLLIQGSTANSNPGQVQYVSGGNTYQMVEFTYAIG